MAKKGSSRETWSAQVWQGCMMTLLELAQEDLDALRSSKREKLRANVQGVADHVTLLVDPTGQSNVATNVPRLSIEDLRTLKAPLVEAIESLYPKSADWVFPFRPLQWAPPVTAIKAIEIVRGPAHFGLIYTIDWPDAFWLASLNLFQRYGNDVSQCVRCRRLYLRTKAGQTFCTKACSQRARSQSWYEKHKADVLERRHKAYRAAHPGLKIPRRKRTRAGGRESA